jgi:DNA-binding beta-propeller fold protein YncE
MKRHAWVLAAVLLGPVTASAELLLPPGFSTRIYVSGSGFGSGSLQRSEGIPSTSTLAFDHTGALFLARTGRRYVAGEVEDLWPIFRIPLGGARITPETESRFFYGPPLPNPQVNAVQGGREVAVTTFDRDRKVGVLYLMRDGLAEFLAGGTPARGSPALLKQPEGVAGDAAGHIYVADRDRGVIVKLEASGRVLDPSWVSVSRPRLLAMDSDGHLWVGGDGSADAPWQRGTGEIWRVSPDGRPTLVLRGPMPAGFALGPGGHLYVADRQGARIFVVTAGGRTVPFATFTDNDAPRTLGFVPTTPQTQRAGIAGDLLLITINRGSWPVNEVLRVSGPFEQLVGER